MINCSVLYNNCTYSDEISDMDSFTYIYSAGPANSRPVGRGGRGARGGRGTGRGTLVRRSASSGTSARISDVATRRGLGAHRGRGAGSTGYSTGPRKQAFVSAPVAKVRGNNSVGTPSMSFLSGTGFVNHREIQSTSATREQHTVSILMSTKPNCIYIPIQRVH